MTELITILNILVILDNLLDPQAQVPPAQRSALVELMYSLSAALLEKSIPHSIGWYEHDPVSHYGLCWQCSECCVQFPDIHRHTKSNNRCSRY